MAWILVLCLLGMALQQGIALRKRILACRYGDVGTDELFRQAGRTLAALQGIGLGLLLAPIMAPISLPLAGFGVITTLVIAQYQLAKPIAKLLRAWVMHHDQDTLISRVQLFKELTVLFWLTAYIGGLALAMHWVPKEQLDPTLQILTLAAFTLSAVFFGRLVPLRAQILYAHQCRQTWLGITQR